MRLATWLWGLVAAVAVGGAAAIFTRFLDPSAPAALIGSFFGIVAFLLGAAGRARVDSPPADEAPGYSAN